MAVNQPKPSAALSLLIRLDVSTEKFRFFMLIESNFLYILETVGIHGWFRLLLKINHAVTFNFSFEVRSAVPYIPVIYDTCLLYTSRCV